MTTEQRVCVVDIVADLDVRFPGVGALTTDQLCQFFSVSKPTARQWMLDHGVRVGDSRMPKIVLARYLASGKR